MLVFTGPPKCSGTTVFAWARVAPASTDNAPIATTALAPVRAAATRNMYFFTFDQPPIDFIGFDIQCASRMGPHVILAADSQPHRRRTQRRPKLTALLKRTLF
jgi:hypothetical protein